MKNHAFLAVLLSLLSGCGADVSPERRVIVVAKPGVGLPRLREIVAAFGGESRFDLGIINAVAATLPRADELASLASHVEILRIDPDVEVRAIDAFSAGEPAFREFLQPPQQVPWGVRRVGATFVSPLARGDGAVVAVLDTGIDRTHPDLAANILDGRNFTGEPDVDPDAWSDDHGHGTHVAGTVAARDNPIGVVGAAPAAKLLVGKVLDRDNRGSVSGIIAGLDWAVANGANVVNMSLGTHADVQAFHDACDNAAAAGVLVVAAAGNNGDGNALTDEVEYPGRYPSVLAVAAIDFLDKAARFSSGGPEVGLCAPGVSVPSTMKGGTYAVWSGTSMAAPHVSGVAALLFGADRAWGRDCVRSALLASAIDLGDLGTDVAYGAGLVAAPAALAWAASHCH